MAMTENEFAYVERQLTELHVRVGRIEANQRNAESGTTACSDAGGVVEQVKTAGSAGREPGVIEEFESWVKEQQEQCVTFDDKMESGYRARLIYETTLIMEWIELYRSTAA